MKHLIAKEHHPHLKKRAVLELFGLGILVWLSIEQRSLLGTALNDIRQSDVLFLMLLFAMYWLLLPLTSISYRMLSEKRLPVLTTSLAQLAAAGPGRIIPGGLGHMSIAAVHLSKAGCSLRRSIIIAVANNVIGFAVNTAIVVTAIAFHPTLLDTLFQNISTENLVLFAAVLLTLFALVQWLSHVRGTRSTVRKVNKEWTRLFVHLVHNPHRLFMVILIAIVVSAGHMSMLLLAGEALSVSIAPSDAFIALGAGVLLGGAVPTPGGLGAVEAGTTTALIALGYETNDAISIALLFRTVTYWMPLLPGTVAYLYLRERKLL